MTKYAANAMLLQKLVDIANLCEIVGADINKVRKGIGSDSRIGHKFISRYWLWWFLFPKRCSSINKTASEHNYELRVLKAVAVNNDQN
jgi:UDPglucose 6-dehydrogenase